MPNRFQLGYVYQRGKKKMWYGFFREDVRTPDGIERKQRLMRLGTPGELPTKNSARNKLAELLGDPTAPISMDLSFSDLTERWRQAEGPTMKDSTLNHYIHALRGVTSVFGDRKIAAINREDIQKFLAEKAKSYSHSTLRSMKVSMGLVLGWADDCGWITKNPCVRIKLPKDVGGRRVLRTVLTPAQVGQLAAKLKEPYATLVIFLAATGLRIGEAIAIKWSDFDGNLLRVQRRIYNRDVGKVKSLRSVRSLPLDGKLIDRINALRSNREWVFCSEAGTPVDPGNARRRYLRPSAASCGIVMGGWHDFRHTLSTNMRKAGVHPKVISDLLGHSKVNLAMDVYDRTDAADFSGPLSSMSDELLSNASNSRVPSH